MLLSVSNRGTCDGCSQRNSAPGAAILKENLNRGLITTLNQMLTGFIVGVRGDHAVRGHGCTWRTRDAAASIEAEATAAPCDAVSLCPFFHRSHSSAFCA